MFERFVRRARHGNVPQVRRALGAGYAATRAVSDMWPDVSCIRLWRAIRVLSRDQSVLGGLSEGTEGVQHEFRIRRPRSFPASGVSSTRSAIRFLSAPSFFRATLADLLSLGTLGTSFSSPAPLFVMINNSATRCVFAPAVRCCATSGGRGFGGEPRKRRARAIPGIPGSISSGRLGDIRASGRYCRGMS